eukprot:Plantae.Rhodophyta-Palmaria_palmata.ctg3673.p1 GENE.Plantae.Rhodophyta-Palmaria_palmata.ctg3673~~Plantae.Rhodophyta-Palmaria_palmata.ctg3673.p1  ORF type:complete len:310 (+),score=31.87 Plantae.Rhodophyta-Palmaria_palmata.ctg3673:1047-1976(+)
MLLYPGRAHKVTRQDGACRQAKVARFFKRSCPENLTKDTRSQLVAMQKACQACSKFSSSPRVFTSRIPHEGIWFNAEIIVDMFYKARGVALPVVDREIKFQAAKFLPDESAGSVWLALLQCWILVFIGPPDIIRHYAGSNLLSREFQKTAGESGIMCHLVAVESSHSMGVEERYHGVVRRVYDRVAADHPALDSDLILAAPVKAINDYAGVDGLVPTLLVFGAMPKLPLPGFDDGALAQTERLAAMTKARDEYADLVDKKRLQIIEDAQQPSSPTDLANGEKLCVYRRTTKAWDGPYRFVRENGMVFSS